jgi:BioD-like phosphotransacetylase family protein
MTMPMSSAYHLRILRSARTTRFFAEQSFCRRRYKSSATRFYEDEEDDTPPIDTATAGRHRRPRNSSSPVYVAATRQHVGKTSTSLALLSGLQKRFSKIGFMKPVGQQSLQVEENGHMVNCDKDAVLVKEHFGLDHITYQQMSPVLIPPGYTRNYLDGKIQLEDQQALVNTAYDAISESSQIVLCEGTGHCAVGSIVHASNAQVARWLNAKMILVANGGLGNTFDELELNKVLCDKEGVEICGVIINKVHPEKLEQTRTYIQKALHMHWGNVPLLGCIPDRPFLGCPALSDLERLFGTALLTGSQHRMRHYQKENLNLVATSLQVFLTTLKTNPLRTLYVCHASRNDILLGFLMHQSLLRRKNPPKTLQNTNATTNPQDDELGSELESEPESALVVTGTDEYPLSDQVMDMIQSMNDDSESAPPVLVAPHPTNRVMEMIHQFTPKLNFEDAHRAHTTTDHYEQHIDFELLLERMGRQPASEEETN